jgi:hypothetical protein
LVFRELAALWAAQILQCLLRLFRRWMKTGHEMFGRVQQHGNCIRMLQYQYQQRDGERSRFSCGVRFATSLP